MSESERELRKKLKKAREALKAALPFIVNESPGGCTGEYHEECDHCKAIALVRAALKEKGE